MNIREAEPADLADCQSLYAVHVLHGTGSFEEVPPTLEEITGRYAAVRQGNGGWLVAADATGVLGFAYYAQFRNRTAYRFCAEDSVYVRDGARGRGIGKALVIAVLDHAAARGFTEMLAVIGDADNAGSIALHAGLGFSHAGVIRRVGYKFGRWLDVVTMQRQLGQKQLGQ